MAIRVKPDDKARLVIPAEIRNELGFREGDAVLIEPVGPGEVRLVRLENRVRAARGMFRHLKTPGKEVAQELIDERRREATAEGGSSE